MTEIEGCTTITEPGYYRLTKDIINSSAEECILIRSNDVVFDGNGHLINGEGRDVEGHRIPIRIGYTNQYHIRNVTVKNVVVTEWFQGVGISRASNNTIRNVTTRYNNQYGIYLGDNATNNTVIDSVATNTLQNGIFLADYSDHNRIVNNDVRQNKNGISVYDSDHNLVANNTAVNNRKKGIVLARGANRNEVFDNNVTRNGRLGIQIHQSHRNKLINNSAINNANQGYLLVNASGNVLRNNSAKSNDGAAFVSGDGSENNTVEDLRINSSTLISFSGANVAMKTANPPALPSSKQSLGTGVEVQNLKSPEGLDLTFHFSEEDLVQMDMSTLELWRYTGSWIKLENSRFDPDTGQLTATVTEEVDVIIPVYEKHETTTSTATGTLMGSPSPEPTTPPTTEQAKTPTTTASLTPESSATPSSTPGQSGFGFAIALLS